MSLSSTNYSLEYLLFQSLITKESQRQVKLNLSNQRFDSERMSK